MEDGGQCLAKAAPGQSPPSADQPSAASQTVKDAAAAKLPGSRKAKVSKTGSYVDVPTENAPDAEKTK